ncbi:MAG: hypothetical protein JJE01_12785 [Gemmatimonadetes bacterium]|nr:hypothetical protein [Gemmatimonadota bacterium]
MRRIWFALIALFVILPTTAVSQEISTGAVKLKFGGRVQLQGATSSCDDFPVAADSKCVEQVPSTDLYLRRVRLTVSGEIGDNIDFKIEPDYNKIDKLGLKDAWGRFNFSNLAKLKAGHFKRPFDEFQLISSTQFPTVERAVLIRGLENFISPSLTAGTVLFNLSDRDIGLELSGATDNEMFSYWVGVFTGDSDLKFQDTNSEKQFVGRGQFGLDIGDMPLKFGVAAAATDEGYETEVAGLQTEYYYDFELFAHLGDFAGGPHVIGSYVFGDNPLQNVAGEPIDLAAGDEFASFQTWQLIGVWRFNSDFLGLEGIEPVFRVTYGDPNTDISDNGGWGYTPGLNVYFYKRNRLVLSWDFASWEESGIRGENSFKAQLQFHF